MSALVSDCPTRRQTPPRPSAWSTGASKGCPGTRSRSIPASPEGPDGYITESKHSRLGWWPCQDAGRGTCASRPSWVCSQRVLHGERRHVVVHEEHARHPVPAEQRERRREGRPDLHLVEAAPSMANTAQVAPNTSPRRCVGSIRPTPVARGQSANPARCPHSRRGDGAWAHRREGPASVARLSFAKTPSGGQGD